MSTSPSIQIPTVPFAPNKSALVSPTIPKTPRSMLKNLFVWKKTSSVQDSDATSPSLPEPTNRPQTAQSTHQQLTLLRKPSLSHRSRSENAVPQRSKTRSKSRGRSQSRCRAVWDPPPLFQAYSQAFMHDTLQIPSKGFLDWLPRNTSNRSSARNPDTTEDDKDDTASPTYAHRRSMSDSNSACLSKKLFFVFENGYILQYKVGGSHDVLPERVLKLSRDSVAFASDAIAGQRWVLEICPNGRTENEATSPGNKMSWSRMTFKTQDTKRLAEKLLLVFESPDALFEWLFAIRKQIEGLGGLKYQPDAPPVPQLDSRRPKLRNASSEYFKRKNGLRFSRSSSALPLQVDDHTAHEKELPEIPAYLVYQKSLSIRSAATSSVVTTTSLEQYRQSYSGSSTAGTAISSGLSVTSSSPTTEAFPPMLSPIVLREIKYRTTTDKTIPRTPTSPLHNSEESPPSFETDPIMGSDGPLSLRTNFSKDQHEFAPSKLDTPISPQAENIVEKSTRSSLNVDRLSALDSILIPDLRLRLRQAHHNLSTQEISNESHTSLQQKPISHSQHMSKASLGYASKGAYGIFPPKNAPDTKMEPMVSTDFDRIPVAPETQPANRSEKLASPVLSEASTIGSRLWARPNGTLKRPAANALSHLLAPLQVEQPMRSPAVTDAMLDSNFGMQLGGSHTEPTTPINIRVPSLSDMNIDKRLLDSLRQLGTEPIPIQPSPSPTSRSVAPRRSMPNFHYGSGSISSAPVGPPPSVPLPAVPAATEGRSSRASTPSKRTSTQSTANRCASTKSGSSTKKIRSPPPSFTFPAQQTRGPRSRSASLKSPPSVEAPDTSPYTSPCLTSIPSPSIDQTPDTIGQVSVISSPSLGTSSRAHNRSSSTSSTKSTRAHPRAMTGPSRTLHNPVTTLAPITRLISPSCGLDLDIDFSNEGCFGISTPRTGN